MSKTKILYLEDSYLREISAEMLEVHETGVVLDQTIFYPEGGGQPTDTGRLDSPKGTAIITRVEKQGNRILHFLDGPIPNVHDEVFLRLDWDRRHAHMRMHTAQHIVSRIVYDLYGARTAGNQIHADYSHIDFAPASFKSTDLPGIEEKVNQVIGQNLSVIIEVIDRTELDAIMGSDRSDLTRLPSSVKEVRLVRVQDQDAYPCAGTHVKSTSELGKVHITKRKKKGKDTVRITYELI